MKNKILDIYKAFILTIIAASLILIYLKIPSSVTLGDIIKAKGKSRQELIRKIPHVYVDGGDIDVSGNIDVSGSSVTIDN